MVDIPASTCAVCGLVGTFCGYHRIGPDKVSLCVACGESPVPVYVLRKAGRCSTGLFLADPEEALQALHALLLDAEPGEGYLIDVIETTNLRLYSRQDFQGFDLRPVFGK